MNDNVLDRLSYGYSEEQELTDALAGKEELDAYRAVTRFKLKVLHNILDNGLTKKQKCYIMLYYRDGLTMQEIADCMGVNRSTVSRTVTAARKKLSALVSDTFIRNTENN